MLIAMTMLSIAALAMDSGTMPKAAAVLSDPASAAVTRPSTANHARVKLITETSGVAPGGTIAIGVHFEMDEGWHIYWDGQNDSGMAPTVKWTLPDGVEMAKWEWPTPKRGIYPLDVIDYIYDKNVTAVATLTVPKDTAVGTSFNISASLTWLVCEEMCVLEKGDVTLKIPVVAPDATLTPTAEAKHFVETRKKLPVPILVNVENGKSVLGREPGKKPGATISGKWEQSTLNLRVEGAKGLVFYPDPGCSTMTNAIKQGESKSEMLRIGLKAKEGAATRASGILEVRRGEEDNTEYYLIAVEAN